MGSLLLLVTLTKSIVPALAVFVRRRPRAKQQRRKPFTRSTPGDIFRLDIPTVNAPPHSAIHSHVASMRLPVPGK